MATFKVGDVVQLKSGGPKMTVTAEQAGGKLWCIWFAGDLAKGDEFKPEVLHTAPEVQPT